IDFTKVRQKFWGDKLKAEVKWDTSKLDVQAKKLEPEEDTKLGASQPKKGLETVGQVGPEKQDFKAPGKPPQVAASRASGADEEATGNATIETVEIQDPGNGGGEALEKKKPLRLKRKKVRFGKAKKPDLDQGAEPELLDIYQGSNEDVDGKNPMRRSGGEPEQNLSRNNNTAEEGVPLTPTVVGSSPESPNNSGGNTIINNIDNSVHHGNITNIQQPEAVPQGAGETGANSKGSGGSGGSDLDYIAMLIEALLIAIIMLMFGPIVAVAAFCAMEVARGAGMGKRGSGRGRSGRDGPDGSDREDDDKDGPGQDKEKTQESEWWKSAKTYALVAAVCMIGLVALANPMALPLLVIAGLAAAGVGLVGYHGGKFVYNSFKSWRENRKNRVRYGRTFYGRSLDKTKHLEKQIEYIKQRYPEALENAPPYERTFLSMVGTRSAYNRYLENTISYCIEKEGSLRQEFLEAKNFYDKQGYWAGFSANRFLSQKIHSDADFKNEYKPEHRYDERPWLGWGNESFYKKYPYIDPENLMSNRSPAENLPAPAGGPVIPARDPAPAPALPARDPVTPAPAPAGDPALPARDPVTPAPAPAGDPALPAPAPAPAPAQAQVEQQKAINNGLGTRCGEIFSAPVVMMADSIRRALERAGSFKNKVAGAFTGKESTQRTTHAL
ncbi:MAG: hypothetical protein SFT68_05355, partial [Rickettsiaceae bacterium]|nr:hypothetical protein [Rickettsiaceae bacterium]